MSILHSADFEPGGVYEGRSRQRRLVVQVVGRYLLWRMVDRGLHPMPSTAEVGEETWVQRHKFAEWAQKEMA